LVRIGRRSWRTELGGDFVRFWTGQTISALGSSFTLFALPLLVFKLTGSAMGLAGTLAAGFLPYPLLGLVIGAWSDRFDRKRLMIAADVGRALVVATIPVLSLGGHLSIWVIYPLAFTQTALAIAFDAGQSATIQRLVEQDQLVLANGRLQAAASGVQLLGPPLAGAIVLALPLESVLFGDALSFLVSAFSLVLIRAPFSDPNARPAPARLRSEISDGLRFVLSSPILRNISLMLASATFFYAAASSELVLFAKERLGAGDSEVGLIFGAGSLGGLLTALAAPALSRRLGFAARTFGAGAFKGLLLVSFAAVSEFWLGAFVWMLVLGCGTLFAISSETARQTLVPNELLGRVRSITSVISWSLMPLGAILGGLLVKVSGSPSLLYLCAGLGISATAAAALLLSPEARTGVVAGARVAVDEC
jgi:MFS family permease